jgi:hypothetical protein
VEVAVATKKKESLLVPVDSMPARRLGRPGVDVSPLKDKIREGTPQAVTNIASEQERKMWRRRLRRAAQEVGMRVETVFVESEERLYFQGRPLA